MLEAYHCLQTSLRRRRNLTSAAGMSNVEASRRSLGFGFWAPNGLNVVCFEFPLRWQIDNGFFNRPIIAGTQILLHRLRPVAYKDFGSSSQTDLTRGFSFDGGTGYGNQTILIQGQFIQHLSGCITLVITIDNGIMQI